MGSFLKPSFFLDAPSDDAVTKDYVDAQDAHEGSGAINEDIEAMLVANSAKDIAEQIDKDILEVLVSVKPVTAKSKKLRAKWSLEPVTPKFLEAGYVYAPYIPLTVTPAVEISDLEYFQHKLFSALKIPAEFVDSEAAKKAQFDMLFPED